MLAWIGLLCVAIVLTVSSAALAIQGAISLDDGWRFLHADPAGAEAPAFDDASWKSVDLPHDWSIAGPIAASNPMGSPGGFFPAGVGWYRKSFSTAGEWAGKQVVITFDGAYMYSEVWINGQKLGKNLNGFLPFTFDLTPHLNANGANLLAVRVDNSLQHNCRWYSGSGIYRRVRLEVRDPLHLAPHGLLITTKEIAEGAAKLDLSITTENDGREINPRLEFATQIFELGPDGKAKGNALASFAPVAGEVREKTLTVQTQATLPDAKPWTPETPHLYVALTTASSKGRIVDARETIFGVRTISVSAEKGFLLNGKPVELYGACVHDDNGALGTAAFDRAEVRRVELLKSAGFNAVRCAHNPYSPAFFDACDRLGLLVIAEAFDCWSIGKNPHDYAKHFNEHGLVDLERMILRDRNHPSIVMWSLGNEIPDFGGKAAMTDGTKLVERCKLLDPTRPTTTAVAGWNERDDRWNRMPPLMKQFDVVGYNYAIHRYEADHKRFPDRVIVGAESFPKDLFVSFDQSDKHSYVIGDFVWTGIDYLGESGIGRYHLPGETIHFHLDPRHFPYHGAYCGDIDITGFRKPISYQRNIVWNRGEKLYTSVTELTPDGQKYRVADWGIVPSKASWTWPGQEGRTLEVQVYSRYDAVRLYLNDKLIGEKPTTRAEQFNATFDVPYIPGTLKTVGLQAGKEMESNVLRTAGPVAKLRLTPDRKTLNADGQDLAFITVESLDETGEFQPNGNQSITFSIEGPATIAGIASGDFSNPQPYQANTRTLFNGRAQLILRSTKIPGTITIQATANDCKPAQIQIELR